MTVGQPQPTRLERYEARTDVVMLVLALAFLGVYSVQVIWRSIPQGLSDALGIANYSI